MDRSYGRCRVTLKNTHGAACASADALPSRPAIEGLLSLGVISQHQRHTSSDLLRIGQMQKLIRPMSIRLRPQHPSNEELRLGKLLPQHPHEGNGASAANADSLLPKHNP